MKPSSPWPRPARAALWALLAGAAFVLGAGLSRPGDAAGRTRRWEEVVRSIDDVPPAELRPRLERLCAEQPGEPMLWSMLGLTLQRLADWPAELEVGRRLERLSPESGLACPHLVLPYEMLGRYDEALAAYRRCAEADPDNVEGLFNFGMFLERRGRYGEAEELYQRLARAPSFLGARLAVARIRMRQGRLAEAESEVAAVLRQSPRSSGALDMGVGTAEALGRTHEAERRRRLLAEVLAAQARR